MNKSKDILNNGEIYKKDQFKLLKKKYENSYSLDKKILFSIIIPIYFSIRFKVI